MKASEISIILEELGDALGGDIDIVCIEEEGLTGFGRLNDREAKFTIEWVG